MATLLLSAAGAAVGSSFSGSVLGLSGAVIGRAVGATIGRVIDQKLLGQGSEPVETGRIDRYKLSGVGEGTPVANTVGRMRLGGQVIWSTHFLEHSTTTGGGGGKGAPQQPKTTSYSYSVSVALALCEGEILHVGRIWADGTLIERDTLALRVYRGTEDQLPDPKMEAVEGAGEVPAYRGMAYVVIEDLDLTPYGNRMPQLSFEVVRAVATTPKQSPSAGDTLRAVAVIPGTGEYSLATTPVSYHRGVGQHAKVNMNTPSGQTDFMTSMDDLTSELPNCQAVSLVVSWFGNDLRAGHCSIQPKVDQKLEDAAEMPWSVSGLTRAAASEIAKIDGRPIYGGTPTDASVIQAIRELTARGQSVMFYPFILMEILAQNGLPDPWSDAPDQAELPWRGRITGEKAAGEPGSPDGTAANREAIDAFFGTVTAADFAISSGSVSYQGPAEWTYSRFILHLAALSAAAGGVAAFCIGSELRALTQMRDDAGFPFVDKLRELAAEVRVILPDAKLGYAADWSEYFGYHPQDGSGDLFFHLDPLWADENIDFIGIDNYMPLADWRDGTDHADVNWGSDYNLDYLKSNIEGGEGFDWYYPSSEARDAQIRVPITDGAGGTPWVYRYKDVRNWWSNLHFERHHPAVRSILPSGADPSAWALSGATVTATSDVYDVFKQPVDIASQSSEDDAIEAAPVVLDADQTYALRVHFRFGTSSQLRLVLRHLSGHVTVTATPGQQAAVSGATSLVQATSLEEHSEEVFTLRVTLRYGTHSALTIAVGPGSDTPDETLHFFGADLSPWPVPPTDWVPQSKPIWFTEIGCPAIDKGANQPNVFFDPKSSESAVPHYSNGRRDDIIQLQTLRAVTQYWADPEINPVSTVYGGAMIDIDRIFAWAWDARPYPAFPNNIDLWSDGQNYTTGHWLSGRISSQSLDLVVAELCRRAGLKDGDIDVSALYGVVRGYSTADLETARARLQPLMLAYDFTAVERDGKIVFHHLPLVPDSVVSDAEAVIDGDHDGISYTRAPAAETMGRVRIAHVEADGVFETRIAEAIFPDDTDITTSQNDLPLSLTTTEARDIAERWLAASRMARDSVELALPPSRHDVQAGAMMELPGGTLWRIDRVEDGGARKIEATRVEPTISDPPDATETLVQAELYVPPVPVDPVFLDLPLLTGEEVEFAPHIAVAATPWPGSVAVYASATADNFALNTVVETSSVIGVLETPMPAAQPGIWDRGPAIRVRILDGSLSSVTAEEVLNGANVGALGADDTGPWEVIQFKDATLVAPDIWEIGLRLRGQAGTEAFMPPSWPAGTLFVLLDGRPQQIELASSARGLARNYRIGPARRSLDDDSFVARSLAFDGVGLRPYAPAHLRSKSTSSDTEFTWIRRTRIDGDSWQGSDVPLGEDQEQYLLRISDAGGLKREVSVTKPAWSYPEAERIADGTASSFTVDVAQVSARFGPGPSTRIMING
ncbi:MAG: glycoside hydrolase TIM-barrel-like domain-containing protein [Pseudomonadota bacterium]